MTRPLTLALLTACAHPGEPRVPVDPMVAACVATAGATLAQFALAATSQPGASTLVALDLGVCGVELSPPVANGIGAAVVLTAALLRLDDDPCARAVADALDGWAVADDLADGRAELVWSDPDGACVRL